MSLLARYFGLQRFQLVAELVVDAANSMIVDVPDGRTTSLGFECQTERERQDSIGSRCVLSCFSQSLRSIEELARHLAKFHTPDLGMSYDIVRQDGCLQLVEFVGNIKALVIVPGGGRSSTSCEKTLLSVAIR
jgi:hypothetical protein